MKSNKIVTVLIVIAVILGLILAGITGLLYYRYTHVFVEGMAYSKNADRLDLTQEDISFEHFDMLQAQLPDCDILWNVPFQNGKVSSGTEKLSIADLSQEDIEIISAYFPVLQTLDASECENYEMLELLRETLPQLEISYGVTLGNQSFPTDTEELSLENGDYDYETLLKNLAYLKSLHSLELKTPELSLEQIQAIQDSYPDLELSCTVEIAQKEYDMQTTHLDLSQMDPSESAAVAEKLPLLPQLATVELNREDGTSAFTMEDVKVLTEAAPGVSFSYSFDFYGTQLNTSMEEVVVKNKRIGDEGEANVRLALDLMQNCKRFVLDNCRISGEVMAQIRDDYRDRTKVVWRIYFGEGTSLTDAEVLRSTYNVKDSNCHDLMYLEDCRYMDIGHNDTLTDTSFISGMKNLEVCIISGAPIKSVAPFTNCRNLRVLEMANCIYVPDISPLAQCENLVMLNVGFTTVSDLTPIYDLKLTNLTTTHSKIPDEMIKKYQEDHKDCWMLTEGGQPYGIGWRYDENKEFLPWYLEIKEAFRYPDSPNNVGWYLK